MQDKKNIEDELYYIEKAKEVLAKRIIETQRRIDEKLKQGAANE